MQYIIQVGNRWIGFVISAGIEVWSELGKSLRKWEEKLKTQQKRSKYS